jgi:hypothetical protein
MEADTFTATDSLPDSLPESESEKRITPVKRDHYTNYEGFLSSIYTQPFAAIEFIKKKELTTTKLPTTWGQK